MVKIRTKISVLKHGPQINRSLYLCPIKRSTETNNPEFMKHFIVHLHSV